MAECKENVQCVYIELLHISSRVSDEDTASRRKGGNLLRCLELII